MRRTTKKEIESLFKVLESLFDPDWTDCKGFKPEFWDEEEADEEYREIRYLITEVLRPKRQRILLTEMATWTAPDLHIQLPGIKTMLNLLLGSKR